MSNEILQYPEAKIISLIHEPDPGPLQPLSIHFEDYAARNPSNATPGDLHLASMPEFYTDGDGNFFLKISLSNGHLNGQNTSDRGTAVFSTRTESGNNSSFYYKCIWEGDSAMPPENKIFMIKVTSPPAEAGGERKQLKWAFQRDGRK